MPRRLVSPTLVGRARELAALDQALDDAARGSATHQLLAGEAGVGKSRLVRELAAMASDRGMRVLVGGCADIGDGGVPYGPIVEALRGLVRDLGDDDLEAVVGPARSDLARLVPSLSPAIPTEAVAALTESLQARLLDALLGVLQRLSAREPVVLVVEDLHWADPATRETIGFLVRQLRSERVLLAMTFRADELHRRHPLLPWLAEVVRSGRVDRIDIERLDPAETQELLSLLLDAPPPPELASQIHRRSDGNPFFVEELLMAGGDGASGRLPPTLREVLLARIVALPELAQTITRIAAVAGRQVEHDLLATVAAMDESTLTDGLRTAVSNQILVAGTGGGDGDDGRYAFRHALLQEAAYDDLLPGERQGLHRRFAEALTGRGAGSGAIAAGHWTELAYHWAAARDDRRSFEASVRAGTAAAATFAFADSRRHLERALELWSAIDGPEALAGMDRVALLDQAATAAWLAGDPRRSVALRREAVTALGDDGDPVRLGATLERLGRALWTNGESEAALAAHERAVSVIPADPPTPERARVLSGYGQILMLLDRWSASIATCELAVAMARATGSRQVEGHAMNTLGLDLAAAGRCDESFTALELALVIAREVANADDIGRAYVNFGEARLYCGDTRGAAAVLREGNEAATEVGVAGTYGRFIRQNAIAVAYELGDWDEATRLADESIADADLGRHQQRYGMTRWVQLLVAQGDERAPAVLDSLRRLLEGYPVETQFHVPYRIAAAEAALWAARPAAALEIVETGLDEVKESEWPRYQIRLLRVGMGAAAELAEVSRAKRDKDAERRAVTAGEHLVSTLEPVLADLRTRQGGLAAAETAAEVATFEAEHLRLARDPAAEQWRVAGDRWLAREKPYPAAYCRWREAEARLGAGDRTSAAAALVEAYTFATNLGARPLLTAIEALAARSRLTLRTDDDVAAPSPEQATGAADPFGLTRRERDVLPLLVKGRTNRQIADELFISENTAGVHVSNILGKLGASTRAEAAGIAVRVGLAGD